MLNLISQATKRVSDVFTALGLFVLLATPLAQAGSTTSLTRTQAWGLVNESNCLSLNSAVKRNICEGVKQGLMGRTCPQDSVWCPAVQLYMRDQACEANEFTLDRLCTGIKLAVENMPCTPPYAVKMWDAEGHPYATNVCNSAKAALNGINIYEGTTDGEFVGMDLNNSVITEAFIKAHFSLIKELMK